MFRNELLEQGVSPDRFISVNFEDMDNSHLLEPELLHQYITERLSKEMTYVFLDEVQLVGEFEKVIDSLHLRKNVDLYVTGSNANMLSGELATMLSGRYIEIAMLPFSLQEFAAGTGIADDWQKLYARYLQESSFPYVQELDGNTELIRGGYLEASLTR